MVVILVILHQHSLAGSIMELLDLDWYSRLLGVKFALLSYFVLDYLYLDFNVQ